MSQLGLKGSFRVAGLYSAGVALGAVGASVAQPNKYMLGASAGVYALIAAHLGKLHNFNANMYHRSESTNISATLILNWNEDGQIFTERKKKSKYSSYELPPSQILSPWIRGLRLLFIVLFTCFDVGQAVYKVFCSKMVFFDCEH